MQPYSPHYAKAGRYQMRSVGTTKFVHIDSVEIVRTDLDGETLELPGPNFIFDLSVKGYFHGMVEVLGQYLLLKSLIPALRPVYIINRPDPPKKFMQEISDLFGVQIVEMASSIKLNEVVYLNINYEFPLYKETLARIARLPRMESNSVYHNNMSNSFIKENVQMLQATFLPSNTGKRFQNIFVRAKDYDADRSVERYWANKGFLPIEMEDYSLQDQINIIHYADKIVMPMGSACTNIIFAKESAEVLLISPHENYQFDYLSFILNNTNIQAKVVGHHGD